MISRVWLALAFAAAGCAPRGIPATSTPAPAQDSRTEEQALPGIIDPESRGSRTPADGSRASSSDKAAVDPKALAAIETTARAMLRELAAARGISAKDDWKVDFIDRSGIRTFVDRELSKQFSEEELRVFGRVESAFGVIPVGVDPRALLLNVYEANVLGLYDPERKTLFVGSFVPPRLLEMVLGHELGHGVQDMHINLQDFLGSIRVGTTRGDADQEAARTCLVEGDAHATYLSWLSGAPGPAGVPDDELSMMRDQILSIDSRATEFPILARMQQLPYAVGTATVLQLARERGWAAVNALYEDLPETSEQMLHLEKLIAREQPAEISVSEDVLAREFDGHVVEWIDTRGEAAWLAALAGPETLDAATIATEGWNGDLFVALHHADDVPPIIVGVTAWDSEDDAIEFHDQLAYYPAFPPTVPVSLRFKREGRNVFFVFTDPAKADAHLNSALDIFRVKRRVKRRAK